MASTFTGDLRVTLSATQSEVLTTATRSALSALSYAKALGNGTSTDQFDLILEASGTIASGGTATLDLAGGTTDRFGTSVTMAGIVAIYLEVTEETSGRAIGLGAGSNPVASIWGAAGDYIKVGPGGVFLWVSPVDDYAVTATTADIITLTELSGAGTSSYKLVILGRSA